MNIEGEYVSMMLSADKHPYRTRFTLLARRNGFTCMIVADDLRQQSGKTTSLLGLAVMLSPDQYGYSEDGCQIVVLDTLANKTEKFVEKDTINVTFAKSEYFKSCALISQTEALVFASEEVIHVSLLDKVQKKLSYPSGISLFDGRSLNIKKEVPYMIVVAEVTKKTEEDMHGQHPSRIYVIGG